jgi:chromate reductase
LRRGSHCTSVLRTLQEAAAERARIEILPLGGIPPYDADEDGERRPGPVEALKAAIAVSDGLVIITPEYNYGISGVLKNALDWASRPAYQSVLKDKLALILSASPAFTGGARAQAQLRQTLAGTLSRVVPAPEVVIASVHTKVQDGRLTDPATLRFSLEAIDALLREIATAPARAAR